MTRSGRLAPGNMVRVCPKCTAMANLRTTRVTSNKVGAALNDLDLLVAEAEAQRALPVGVQLGEGQLHHISSYPV